jgi:hypothetical protein
MKKGSHTAEGLNEDYVRYGLSHFSLRLLDFSDTREEGLKKETRYIHLYQTYVPEYGYNGNDQRFKGNPISHLKCPDNELTQRIKKQGYTLHQAYWKLRISYRSFVVKLNNPDLFTDEELRTLNEFLSLSSNERIEKYKLCGKELSHG